MAHDRDRQADFIKIAAVLTAIPRWTGALLEAEGVPIPAAWLGWWRVVAALLSVGMAVTEALAISYVLNAWRNQHDKYAWRLGVLALAALFVFTLVLAPYIAANVRGVQLAIVLGDGWLWWVWSIAVASSTGIVVGAVGYAQKGRAACANSPSVARIDANVRERDANEARTIDRDSFIVAYRANGHASIAELARTMGVNTRTAQKWVAGIGDTGVVQP